jgi:hypothetical protein
MAATVLDGTKTTPRTVSTFTRSPSPNGSRFVQLSQFVSGANDRVVSGANDRAQPRRQTPQRAPSGANLGQHHFSMLRLTLCVSAAATHDRTARRRLQKMVRQQ